MSKLGRREPPPQQRFLGDAPSVRFGLLRAAQRSSGGQHPFGPLLRELGESCRLVDGIADHRVLEALRGTDVARDGHPTNVQIEQSSGVPSLDISAVRALQRIDTFGPLPSDYSGSKISVEFWFDYKR